MHAWTIHLLICLAFSQSIGSVRSCFTVRSLWRLFDQISSFSLHHYTELAVPRGRSAPPKCMFWRLPYPFPSHSNQPLRQPDPHPFQFSSLRWFCLKVMDARTDGPCSHWRVTQRNRAIHVHKETGQHTEFDKCSFVHQPVNSRSWSALWGINISWKKWANKSNYKSDDREQVNRLCCMHATWAVRCTPSKLFYWLHKRFFCRSKSRKVIDWYVWQKLPVWNCSAAT